MKNAAQPDMSTPRSFHVMTKPVGPLCNLNCRYCFYLEKEELFSGRGINRMSDEVLETYIRQYIGSQEGPEIQFGWQGGEPSLAGIDFFRKAVALQQQYSDGRPVHNSFQTNGTQLDDEWCGFLADENFLVGLSLDGPEAIHNRYRVDKKGAGSFDAVMRGLERLKKRGVEFNTLTCITRESPGEAVGIYRFLKKQGVQFMQFIPIVERAGNPSDMEAGLKLAAPPDLCSSGHSDAVMPWSVSPKGFGRFMCAVFDEWIKRDVGRIFVNLFDSALGAWLGEESMMCTHARRCGGAVAMELDGRVYSCDHYVYPSYFLGNILETPLDSMVYSDRQVKFGRDKQDALPAYCRACEYLFACNGDCPKHRFAETPSGEPGLSYLCEGYKLFFRHIEPTMDIMSGLVRSGCPAADIMRQNPDKSSGTAPGRNDLCPCGSGKKYKRCCGKTVSI